MLVCAVLCACASGARAQWAGLYKDGKKVLDLGDSTGTPAPMSLDAARSESPAARLLARAREQYAAVDRRPEQEFVEQAITVGFA